MFYCVVEVQIPRFRSLKQDVANYLLVSKGGTGGVNIPLPVPLLEPPAPFCELSPVSRLFSNDLAMLLD